MTGTLFAALFKVLRKYKNAIEISSLLQLKMRKCSILVSWTAWKTLLNGKLSEFAPPLAIRWALPPHAYACGSCIFPFLHWALLLSSTWCWPFGWIWSGTSPLQEEIRYGIYKTPLANGPFLSLFPALYVPKRYHCCIRLRFILPMPSSRPYNVLCILL